VIWVVTIAIFFGTVAAVMLLLLVYAQRQTIRNAIGKTGRERQETRVWAKVSVELSSLSEPSLREITRTRNVSHHGACALTKNHWLPNSKALVRFLYEDVSVRARIAYCQPSGDAFMIGLQFATAIDPRIPPADNLTFR
jgi:PilZ domain